MTDSPTTVERILRVKEVVLRCGAHDYGERCLQCRG